VPGYINHRPTASKIIELAGRRFGRWIVLAIHPERVRYNNRPHILWLCRCDCGAERLVIGGDLRRGASKGCRACARLVHGHSRKGRHTRAYRVWCGMLQRCYNPNQPQYADWGGRGIRVCERWHSFVNFLVDMGEPPPGLTIERKNNDGNYEPSNCKWATRSEQQRNRRPPKLRIKRGDPKILAGLKQLTESLARAAPSF
jgi:pentatricopeptide repeat protein